MKLFVSDTPITFPHSEYGGVITIIAESKGQWEEILKKHYEYEISDDAFDLSKAEKSLEEYDLLLTKEYKVGVASEFLT
jgi:hypothetical protein